MISLRLPALPCGDGRTSRLLGAGLVYVPRDELPEHLRGTALVPSLGLGTSRDEGVPQLGLDPQGLLSVAGSGHRTSLSGGYPVSLENRLRVGTHPGMVSSMDMATDEIRLRDGCRIPGEILGSVTCPRRGSFVRIRLFDGDHAVGVLRVAVGDVKFSPTLAAILAHSEDGGHCGGSVTKRSADRLVLLGLAERRGFGVYLTPAGFAARSALPVTSEHRTQTHQRGEKVFNPARANGAGRWVVNQTSTWWCSCGADGAGATREEARAAARRHRESMATTATSSR